VASIKLPVFPLLLVIGIMALGLRCWQLDRRPMHHDEANQAVRTGGVLETGVYRYDLEDHHGPTLYYLTLPLAWLSHQRDLAHLSVTTVRLVPVLFGVALILSLGLLSRGLGRGTVLCAAAFTALSPAVVYYNRFYIQESVLVFFTFGAIIAGWRHVRTEGTAWALVAGACLGLMYATKETCVIAYAGMLAGILVVHRHHDDPWPIRRRHMLNGVAMAAAFAVTLLCSFFTNPAGPVDSVLSFGVYLNRAGTGGAQVHPWYYYFQNMIFVRHAGGPVWSEGLIVGLALVGGVAAWRRRDFGGLDERLLRFLTVFTVVVAVLYSLIPYKTPWLMLTFHQGLILLAGFGVVTLWRARASWSWRLGVAGVLVAGLMHYSVQLWRTNFRYESDPRNPYAYVQTSRDFLKLVDRIVTMTALVPAGGGAVVAVVTNPHDAWPLPWYLRKLPDVGYWADASSLPVGVKPAVIVTSMDKDQPFDGYETELYQLRPDVFLNLHVRGDLWRKFMEKREGSLPVGP